MDILVACQRDSGRPSGPIDPIRHRALTAFLALLDRRTGNRAIGAEHAASRLRAACGLLAATLCSHRRTGRQSRAGMVSIRLMAAFRSKSASDFICMNVSLDWQTSRVARYLAAARAGNHMGDGITDIAGIEIPSTNPVFLTVVGIHVLLGLACVITGAIAMLSRETCGPPSPQRDDLFLVPGRRVPDRGRSGRGALGSRLPFIYPWAHCRLRRPVWAGRPDGSAGAIGSGCTSLEWERPIFCF